MAWGGVSLFLLAFWRWSRIADQPLPEASEFVFSGLCGFSLLYSWLFLYNLFVFPVWVEKVPGQDGMGG